MKYNAIIWSFLEGKREYPTGDENQKKGKKEWATKK